MRKYEIYVKLHKPPEITSRISPQRITVKGEEVYDTTESKGQNR